MAGEDHDASNVAAISEGQRDRGHLHPGSREPQAPAVTVLQVGRSDQHRVCATWAWSPSPGWGARRGAVVAAFGIQAGLPPRCTSGFGSGSAGLVTGSGCTAVLTVEVVATARRLLDEASHEAEWLSGSG